MVTVTLSTGKQYKIDSSSMSVREWRGLKSALFSTAEDDRIIAKYVDGLTAEEIPDMTERDLQLVIAAIYKDASRPIDPNSLSASISA